MKILISLLLLFTAACATIPPESVELSQLVGEMISSAKISHVNMVNRHFDKLRADVDAFSMKEYKDAYLSNIRKLAKEKDPNFVELSFDQYDRALERIMKKRSEWLQEVENNRLQVLQALEEHYSLLLASNSEVTAMLRSAANLTDTREALLNRFGPTIGISGTKIKEVEDKLLEGTNSINSILTIAKSQLGG